MKSMHKPFIIGIGGTNSGVGKTTTASAILKYLTSENIFNKWGALKFTKTSSSPRIIADREILMEKGKDTRHMLTAGATDVLWIRSNRTGLDKILSDAVKRFSHLDGIVAEGNSLIEFLKPDIVIFILGKEKALWKSDIEKIIVHADIILHDRGAAPAHFEKKARFFHSRLSDKDERRSFFRIITGCFMKEKLKEELMKKAVQGKISCAVVRKIAEDLQMSYKDAGAAADELGIRIKDCQLGCF